MSEIKIEASRKQGRILAVSEAQRDVMDEARDVGGWLNEEPPGGCFHYCSSGNLTQIKLSDQKKYEERFHRFKKKQQPTGLMYAERDVEVRTDETSLGPQCFL